MIVDDIFKEIDRGRQGKNHGIPFGLPKLEGIIDGVTPETYTLLMSNSGSGKTSLALYAYVYMPIVQHIDDGKYKVVYFSLEMNEVTLYLKLLSIHLFKTEGKILTFKEILSRKKGYVLSDEDYMLLCKYRPWLEKISQHLEIYDKNVTAKGLYKKIKSKLEQLGKFTETEDTVKYTPNDPDIIVNFIVDHVGLITPVAPKSLKGEIDEFSSMCVWFREKTKASFTLIQQANREQGNVERLKLGRSAFTLNDAKDTGVTVQDSTVFLALYNPFRDGLNTYHKWDISQLQSNFRAILVLKNRFGDCDVEVGVNFFGGINIFNELPKGNEIYDYEKYTNPYYLLNNNENEDETEEKRSTEFNYLV